MARESFVVTNTWCDPCFDSTPVDEEPLRVPAVREITLAVGTVGRAVKQKILGVCEQHDKESIQLVEEWYTHLAQENPDKKPRAVKAAPAVTPPPPHLRGALDDVGKPCVVCVAIGAETPTVPSTVDSLRTHIAARHSIGWAGYKKIRDGQIDITGLNADGSIKFDFKDLEGQVYACPKDGCNTSWDDRLFDSPPRLVTSHVKKEHPELAKAS
jgi:hypothetical protein